jgi:hypothetical protein
MPLLANLLVLVLLQEAPSPASLVEDVRKLSESTTNEQRFDAVTSMLTARKIPFTIEPFRLDKPVRGRSDGRNIVVTLGQGTEDLVIGAHYDATYLKDGTLSRGAVDNAGSSVMLVHLAEALRNERLPLRVRIVWFDMEELGLLGSTRYLAAHRDDRIAAMLNFDINAYGDTILFGAPPGGDAPALRKAIIETCADEQVDTKERRQGVPVDTKERRQGVPVDCVRFGALPNSDDRPFGKAGIPTLSIAVLPAAEAHQLWLLLEGVKGAALPGVLQIIHTPNDVLDHVDGATIAMMRRFALALVKKIADQ